MTGQVKEGVLIRWGELGVHVADGCVNFRPTLLDPNEFLDEPRPWDDIEGTLDAGTLGFTYCGVPVVYRLSDSEPTCTALWSDGSQTHGTAGLGRDTSTALFSRTGKIARIDVNIGDGALVPQP
jgi:hypothetical protein